MRGVSEFLTANVVLVYFIYGLAFFTLGLVTSLQARALSRLHPINRLWLLSLFGLLHGVSEWLELAYLQGWLAWAQAPMLHLALKAASFVFLFQFGAEILRALRPAPGWVRLLAPGLFLAWLGLMLAAPVADGMGSARWLAIADAAMRYALAFPGAALASYALWETAAKRHGLAQSRPAQRYFKGAAVGLAVYAVVGGLTVPAAPFFPASVLNRDVFEATVGAPALVFRTLSAVAVSGFLAEAFVVEVSRAQARAVDVLRDVDRLREEFISVVAHDLRTPITVITGYARIVKDLPPERHNTALEQRALEGIQSSARRLERMVADLLDASRIEARRMTLQREWVDLPRLVREVVERNAALTTGHPVQVVAKEGIPEVRADPLRLEQILANLLSNAAKYAYPTTPITVTLEPAPVEAVVAVTNRGPGITPDERQRLFTRFHRTKEAQASQTPGLGLGLYITKGLVEAHGGQIWVESAPGEETTFYFTLPVEHP